MSKSLAALDLDEKNELIMLQTTLDAVTFDSLLKLKWMLEKSATAAAAHAHQVTRQSRSLLPIINMPTFNSNILFWKYFWEQFSVTVSFSP